ncbi:MULTISPECIES: LysR family transcriptional regulator [Bacillus]|uniref:LysR family transcriptional regulator n=2 Tax=Bacillus TaxID=1386 RepID=A0A0M4FVT3_9BACI|nr:MULTISPECIES: LysR family transcriptional regulator [Bacillus]ALC80888.1 LysR family transcriptional regulator [Bacillus gobiensis]MBP1079829.1 DNA-binding transcriptional LysR family regulator [Bacillus capparidis]MED1095218.1 LysR family transcriptional regulator [Bacillus capparidis]
MQLYELQMLVVLAEERNMRKASERLFVSQPALSQRLQSIEKSWGVQIFLRSQKGLTVTSAGEKIIQFANDVTKEKEKVKESIEELEGEIYGTLKLAAASIIGQHWLPGILKSYIKRFPKAKVSLLTGWSSEMVRALYDDQVHIGIIRGNPEWKGEKRYLMTDYLYLADTEIDCIEDLAKTERPFIQFKSDSTYYQEIQHWWYQKFKTSPKQTIIVDQIETCKQMAYHGIGYAILPSVTLNEKDETEINKIPLLDLKGNPIGRDTWLLGYESTFQLKQVEAFVSVVEEKMKDSGS